MYNAHKPVIPYLPKHKQCDQIKFAKCLEKLPKTDFTRKIIDFDTFTIIA